MRSAAPIRAAFCGVLWGALAVLLWIALVPPPTATSFLRLVWHLRGGLVAAPFIGVVVGLCSPRFSRFGFAAQSAIAIGTLYASAFAFILAAAMTDRIASRHQLWSLRMVLFNSLNTAVAGLTWTGFVLFLGPLSYLTHRWVSPVPTCPGSFANTGSHESVNQ